MTDKSKNKRSKISIWFQAVRAFAFPATIVPVLVGAMCALFVEGPVKWWLFPLILLASLSYHVGANLVSDYYDYKKSVDRPDTHGSSRTLVEGLLSPNQVYWGGVIALLIGAALGLYMVSIRGIPLLILGIIGFIGCYIYCAPPFPVKYNALGEVLVFIGFGPLMTIGSYFVLTGQYEHTVLLVSLPIGCMVAAILQANDLRDIYDDAKANIKTASMLFGETGARIYYHILVLGAFLITIAMVGAGVTSRWTLLTLISLPLAFKLMKIVQTEKIGQSKELIMMDARTAQMHMLFGVLLSAGLFLGWLF
jgi:1,4-dihydroxy-2-naphthoate polyprenyltransferase